MNIHTHGKVVEYTGSWVKNELKWGIIKDNLKIKIRSMYMASLVLVGLCVCVCFVFAKDAYKIEKKKANWSIKII